MRLADARDALRILVERRRDPVLVDHYLNWCLIKENLALLRKQKEERNK